MPERIQQRRTKGWQKPDNTISVARPSRYGNPFAIGRQFTIIDTTTPVVDRSQRRTVFVHGATEAVELYRDWMTHRIDLVTFHTRPTTTDMRRLAGKNLMCFCALGTPCHVDVLLPLANPTRAGVTA